MHAWIEYVLYPRRRRWMRGHAILWRAYWRLDKSSLLCERTEIEARLDRWDALDLLRLLGQSVACELIRERNRT